MESIRKAKKYDAKKETEEKMEAKLQEEVQKLMNSTGEEKKHAFSRQKDQSKNRSITMPKRGLPHTIL